MNFLPKYMTKNLKISISDFKPLSAVSICHRLVALIRAKFIFFPK